MPNLNEQDCQEMNEKQSVDHAGSELNQVKVLHSAHLLSIETNCVKQPKGEGEQDKQKSDQRPEKQEKLSF